MELIDVFAKYMIPAKPANECVDLELCKRCGGLCCKTMGCHISPFSLKEISVESIINFIDEAGCISIDWWEGNPITEEGHEKGYFLRIRNKDADILDPSYGGKCSILTETGCPLPFEYRPSGGATLIPVASGECIPGYSKHQCAIDWYAYHDIMEEVFEYYQQKYGFHEKDPKDLFDYMMQKILGLSEGKQDE